MPDFKRQCRTGSSVYFTVGLKQRGSDLLIREINLLRASVGRTLRDRPVEVRAWVILPDHMHCVWTMPDGDHDFSTRWRLIKARFSRGLPKGPRSTSEIARQERGIWQRRFWEHHIGSGADMAAHLEHCWMDPVRHGLVHRPEHWRYSSFAKLRRVKAA